MRRGSTAYIRLPFPVIPPGLIVHRRTCREHHCIRERPSRSPAANRKGARVHVLRRNRLGGPTRAPRQRQTTSVAEGYEEWWKLLCTTH